MPTTQPVPTLPAEFLTPTPSQRFVLDAVSWDAYEAIGAALADRGGLRLTYDSGRLELMTTSYGHEKIKYLLGMLVDVITEEMNLLVAGGGSTTFKRADMEKGLEPDQCFYSAHFHDVAGKKELDLNVDPPPDLVIEVDVSHSSIKRLPLYAALGVPEVWRWVNGSIQVLELDESRSYQERSASFAFAPQFDPNEFVPFLEVGITRGNAAMTREFRAWLRQWLTERGLTA